MTEKLLERKLGDPMKKIPLMLLMAATLSGLTTGLATGQTHGFSLNPSAFNPPKNILDHYRPIFCGFVPLTPESTVYVQCRLLPVSATNENCPDLTCSQALWFAKLDATGTIEKDWLVDEKYLQNHLEVKGLEILWVTYNGKIFFQDPMGSSQEVWVGNLNNSKIDFESFWTGSSKDLVYPVIYSTVSFETGRHARLNIIETSPDQADLEIIDYSNYDIMIPGDRPAPRLRNLKAGDIEFKPLTAKFWKTSTAHHIISGSAFLPSVKQRGLKMWMGDEKATNPQYILCLRDQGAKGIGTFNPFTALLPEASLFFPIADGEMGIIRNLQEHELGRNQFVFQKLGIDCKLSLPQIIDYPQSSKVNTFADAELLQAQYLPDNSFILLYRAVSNEKITDHPIMESGQQFLMVVKFALSESTPKLVWTQEIPLDALLDPGVDPFITVDPSLTADFHWVSDKQGLVFVHNRNISKNISYYPEKSFAYLNFLKISRPILQIYSFKLEDDACTEC